MKFGDSVLIETLFKKAISSGDLNTKSERD